MATERKFVRENMRRMLLKEYVIKETERAGFGGLHIQRTPMGTRITLIVERPGLVIGRRGSSINRLTEHVENIYGFDNPQIEVVEEEKPELNAQVMAQKVAMSLERGWHFRRVGHSTVRRIMQAGAKGCQVTISGKLTGERHRTEKFRSGHIKYCGHPAIVWMERGFAVAKKKAGVIGVKVDILKPDAKLPDEVEMRSIGDIIHEEGSGEAVEVLETEAGETEETKVKEQETKETETKEQEADVKKPKETETEEPKVEETKTEETKTEKTKKPKKTKKAENPPKAKNGSDGTGTDVEEV